ncbi:MAG: response regulator [Bacteroidetes bacterium]|nr:response regulator [Bacteroidota bacterium]
MKKIKDMRIFVVEDEKMYSRLIESSLKRNGFGDVRTFASGEECIENLDETPDIVLLDYRLGELNGIDVLKEIRKKVPGTRVIFLSGEETLGIIINAMKLGASDFILKNDEAVTKMTKTIRNILLRDLMSFNKKIYKRVALVSFCIMFVAIIILLIYSNMYPDVFNR